MRRFIPLVLIAVLSGGSMATLALSVHQAQPDHRVTVWVCGQSQEFEPTVIPIACGDDNYGLVNLRWMQWGSSSAFARGTVVVDNCNPDCANGTISRSPIDIRVYGLVRRHYWWLNGTDTNIGLDNGPVSLSGPWTN